MLESNTKNENTYNAAKEEIGNYLKYGKKKLNLRFYLESLSEIKYWLGLNRIEVDVYVVIEL